MSEAKIREAIDYAKYRMEGCLATDCKACETDKLLIEIAEKFLALANLKPPKVNGEYQCEHAKAMPSYIASDCPWCNLTVAEKIIENLKKKRPLEEKEVEMVLSKIETPIEESLLEFTQTKDKAIVRLKPKWTTLISKAICSHFSKPNIVYPEKKGKFMCDCVKDCHCFDEINGYNQAIDDMRSLNEKD